MDFINLNKQKLNLLFYKTFIKDEIDEQISLPNGEDYIIVSSSLNPYLKVNFFSDLMWLMNFLNFYKIELQKENNLYTINIEEKKFISKKIPKKETYQDQNLNRALMIAFLKIKEQ